ncbi:MAG: 6-phosphogluconolactonase [Rhodoferax sp.]|nr:6-phosphogluconolactonase [Rhodoferax sp.]
MDERMRIERVGLLKVEVHPTRAAMGFAAAAACRRRIQEAVARRGLCRMIFAAAPSQNELLTELRTAEDIPWERIVAFHMALFDHVPLKGVCLLDTGGLPIADEMQRYISLLNEAPIDLVCLGVGENGHIAFNDPHVADFNDPFLVKEVELDESCRLQQVHDGAFASLEVVPERAITLTVPALTRGESLFCVVPGPRKALAVKTMLTGPIDESCPASVLRRHPDCTLYLDDESASIWLKTLV